MQWEVPGMATISQLYFEMLGIKPDERTTDRMIEKANFIYKHGLRVADFGTRRRFSVDTHDQLVGIMKDVAGPFFLGTSNLMLAMKYDVEPIGTQAHELYMLYAAAYGVEKANPMILEMWEKDYKGRFLTALTDTYTTDVFFKQMTAEQAKRWQGLRQDSGDPLVYLEKAIAFYEMHGIDPKKKRIVFSDSLDVHKALEIRDAAKGRIECVFGIGTNLTNDVGAKPLNIVIKLDALSDRVGGSCVKLSDTPGKSTGDRDTVYKYKSILKLQ
jgi:nicotinate phosphoribosyltransferase